MLYHNTQHAGVECNNGFFFTFFRFLRVFPRAKRFHPIQGGVLVCTSWERFLSLSRMPAMGIDGFTNANGVTFFTRSQNGVNLRPIFGVWGLSRNVPYGRQGLEGPAYITGRAKIKARSFRCSEGQNWGKAGPFWPLRHPEHGQITKNVLFCFVLFQRLFCRKNGGRSGAFFRSVNIDYVNLYLFAPSDRGPFPLISGCV